MWHVNVLFSYSEICHSLYVNALANKQRSTRVMTVSNASVPGGLVVRIRRSHRRGRGSIPRLGSIFSSLFFFADPISRLKWNYLDAHMPLRHFCGFGAEALTWHRIALWTVWASNWQAARLVKNYDQFPVQNGARWKPTEWVLRCPRSSFYQSPQYVVFPSRSPWRNG